MTQAATVERTPTKAIETHADLSQMSFGEGARKALGVAGSAIADWGGRICEGIDYLLDVPRKAFGLARYIPLPGSELVGNTVGTIASSICSFMVHTPTFGVLKWMKYLRRGAAVSGAVNEAIAPDGNVDSVTVKSFLSTVSDRKLRGDLEEYFVVSKSIGKIAADETLSDTERSEKTNAQSSRLAKLELVLSRRAELNELKQLAGLEDGIRKASEQQLDRLAERMADKMIKLVESRYEDRLGALGGKVEGDWLRLAADGEKGRPVLVSRIKERLLGAYLAERENGSGAAEVAEIRKDLGEAFKASATLREAVFYTVLPIMLYGPAALDINVGQVAREWGQQAMEWLGEIAPQLVPEWVRNALTAAGEAVKTAYDLLWWIGGGWLAAKGIEASRGFFGGDADARPIDGTHMDSGPHFDSGSDARGMDATDARPIEADSARPADGSSLLDSVRSQADSAADSSARLETARGDAGDATRSPIDTGARPVDGIHGSRPHADTRVGDLQGRTQDPSVRVETVRVNPR